MKTKLDYKLDDGSALPINTKPYLEPYKKPLESVKDGYGYLGTVAYNDKKTHMQCHICGYFFRTVGDHASKVHGIKADEYREKFQLMNGRGLIAPASRENYVERWAKLSPEEKQKAYDNLKKGRESNNRRGKANHLKLEKKNLLGKCPDQLIDKIQKLAKKLNKTPTRRQFEHEYGMSMQIIYATFGSWNEAVKMSNLQPNIYMKEQAQYTHDGVLEMIRNFTEIEGREPHHSDLKSPYMPSPTVVIRLFSGLINANKIAKEHSVEMK